MVFWLGMGDLKVLDNCVSFFPRTVSGFCTHHLLVSWNFSFLDNSK